MSSHNYLDSMCHKDELIYHQAPYTIETFNDVSPVYYDSFLPYEYEQTIIVDDVPNNLGMEILDFVKFFFLEFLFSFFLSAISLFWSSVQFIFHKLYKVVIIGFSFLPHFPILSFYPFPYSLWVVFLWFLDFLELLFLIIFIPMFTFLCGVYMFVFELLFIPFCEF